VFSRASRASGRYRSKWWVACLSRSGDIMCLRLIAVHVSLQAIAVAHTAIHEKIARNLTTADLPNLEHILRRKTYNPVFTLPLSFNRTILGLDGFPPLGRFTVRLWRMCTLTGDEWPSLSVLLPASP
jgi:hypothetical protein